MWSLASVHLTVSVYLGSVILLNVNLFVLNLVNIDLFIQYLFNDFTIINNKVIEIEFSVFFYHWEQNHL